MSHTAPRPATWTQGLWAALRLVRPLNVVMFMAGVFVGGVMSGGAMNVSSVSGIRLAVAALSAALIGGAANAFNDVCDLGTDRINRPERPLPSGLVSVRVGQWLWAILSLVGSALGAWVSAEHALMALGAVGLLAAYSRWLKRLPLAGNLTVALVVALALVYGGLAVGSPGASLVGAGFAFLMTLAREIVKDVEDQPGDVFAGSRTLPVVAGTGAAFGVAAAVVAITILLTPLPFLVLGYSGLFLLIVLAVDGLLLRTLARLYGAGAAAGRATMASRLLKGAMLVGLAALTVA